MSDQNHNKTMQLYTQESLLNNSDRASLPTNLKIPTSGHHSAKENLQLSTESQDKVKAIADDYAKI